MTATSRGAVAVLEAVAHLATRPNGSTVATNQELAELSGTSRTTVIRSLRLWEVRGVLALTYERGCQRTITVARSDRVSTATQRRPHAVRRP